jgi:hypothetical protein
MGDANVKVQLEILRVAIAAAFAIQAAIAGYHVVLVMSQIGAPSLAWREVFVRLVRSSLVCGTMEQVNSRPK